jgi:hypothetical protein
MVKSLSIFSNNKKLNLSSGQTKQKVVSLFLFSWLATNSAEAGQGFKNCLLHLHNDSTSYNSLLNFDFSSQPSITGDKILSLCNCSKKCSPCDYGYSSIDCVNIDQSIFSSYPISCGGIVGDTLITVNATRGAYCAKSNFSNIASSLVALPAKSITGLDKGYAFYNCPSSSFCSGFDYCN